MRMQDVVLMRALRDMNLPKFVYDDVPLFRGLIGDLFPGLDCPRVRYPNFNDAVEETLQKNKYILLPQQVRVLILDALMLLCFCFGCWDVGQMVIALGLQSKHVGFETQLRHLIET